MTENQQAWIRLPTFRFTLPALYSAYTPGFMDPGARGGHYAEGATPEAARRALCARLVKAGYRPDIVSSARLDRRRVPWNHGKRSGGE